ncbi:MAG: PLP-dependent cysteine synthase family protein [Rhodospirillaceae bacterium]|nr:PLP-dependent cysteine synthase family protein [Rhodospirillaceae bacterium]
MSRSRDWRVGAVRCIEADNNRSADTHLFRLELPGIPNAELYFKDESTHPTRSLKHRLARSLFLYAICNGWVEDGTTVIEASSGSTAVSEAYFARLLGLEFIAVMPKSTSPEKITAIEFYGGRCHFVDSSGEIYAASQRLAEETGGHYMDQFTFAERATDWRGNNNIAQSIFEQMAAERHPVPRWIVVSAGTGGTAATIGRYLSYQSHSTRLCVCDPENSVFYDCYTEDRGDITIDAGSRVEGIGRPRCEPSFLPGVIDHMIQVPDVATFAAMRVLAERVDHLPGGSTGTNLYAALQVIRDMVDEGLSGSVVTLLCDPGERYRETYYSDAWLAQNGFDIAPYTAQINRFLDTGVWLDI